MDLAIRVPDQDVESLVRWLDGEAQLRGRVSARMAAPGPGEMGAGTEALIVALGSGGAVSVLIGSLSGWLRTRPPTTIEIEDGSGHRISISSDSMEHAQAALEQARVHIEALLAVPPAAGESTGTPPHPRPGEADS
jgi:Effector Associated Constant Component 1